MKKFGNFKSSSIVGLLLLTIGLVSGLYLVQQTQELRERAATLPSVCSQVNLSVNPQKQTYEPLENIHIRVDNVPQQYKVSLHFIPTSKDTNIGWSKIPINFNPNTNSWETDWNVPNTLDNPGIYSESDYQEFFLVANIRTDTQLVCTGNLYYDPKSYLPPAGSPNLHKVIITKPADNGTNLNSFWNITPGYSLTYKGERFDNPLDNNGNPVDGSFNSRIEYEAPVEVCDGYPVIPQRFTKDSVWGYWGAARPKPEDRNNNIWTNGKKTLRFLLTTPDYNYSWKGENFGALGHKIYNFNSNLGALGSFNSGIVHTSFNAENYYYDPYFLSTGTLTNSPFIRVDSIYGTDDSKSSFCAKRTKLADHYWYTRMTMLDDPELINEFGAMSTKFPGRDILVLTYFESVEGGILVFREDWYLMDGVGLVGIDQARWKPEETDVADIYFEAKFMKNGSSANPHISMRADRAYLGEPLNITLSNTTIPQDSTYELTAVGSVSGLPYDGFLEVDGNRGVVDWTDSDGNLHWVENGKVSVYIPPDFPLITITARFRPKVVKTPSVNETLLPYSEMPWSNEITVEIVESSGDPGTLPPVYYTPTQVRGDLDGDNDIDINDFNIFVNSQNFGKTGSPGFVPEDIDENGIVDIFDFNIVVSNYSG